MRLWRSRAIPGHQNRSASERRSGVGLGVPPRDGNRPLLHCGVFEAPRTEDGLLGRPDIGLAIQEAVLEEQSLLGLTIGSCSFLIENRQESFFEGFPGSPKVLHHLVEHQVILLFYLPIYDIGGGQFRCPGGNSSSGLAFTPSGFGRTPSSARSSRGVMALSNTALTPG